MFYIGKNGLVLLILIFLLLPGGENMEAKAAHEMGLGIDVVVEPALKPLFCHQPNIYCRNGCVYVVGEVENTGACSLSWVEVEVEFYGAQEQVLDRQIAYIKHLNSGEKKPYRLLAFEPEPITGVKIRLGEGLTVPEQVLPLVVENLAVSAGPGNFLQLTGQIVNNGSEVIDFVKLTVSFITGTGEIVDSTSFFLSNIPAGGGKGFSFYSQVEAGWTEVSINFD
ncbi:MAG: FxLYD domain-containing protein [bacterium]|jgi:hypothetical protein